MADIELGLGRTDAAVQLTRRAQATVDGFEDKYSIAVWSGVNADLYSRIGRADLAVPLLDRILASPNGVMAYSSALLPRDRKSVVEGKSVSVRVDHGGGWYVNKNKTSLRNKKDSNI